MIQFLSNKILIQIDSDNWIEATTPEMIGLAIMDLREAGHEIIINTVEITA